MRNQSAGTPRLSKLSRIRKLSMRDAVVLMQLLVSAIAIEAALRVVGWQRLAQAIIARSRTPMLRRFPAFHLHYEIDGISALADGASSLFPRNRCLVRSMLMLWLLRTRGIPAEVVLGVRKRAGAFEAHAWARSDAGVIGENPEEVADFAVMASSNAVSDAAPGSVGQL